MLSELTAVTHDAESERSLRVSPSILDMLNVLVASRDPKPVLTLVLLLRYTIGVSLSTQHGLFRSVLCLKDPAIL